MPARAVDENGDERLTIREQIFVEHAARGKSLTQAAVAAGYSPHTARTTAAQNVSKRAIYRAIDQRIACVRAETDEILATLSGQMRGNLADFADCWLENGDLDWQRAEDKGVARLVRDIVRKPRWGPDGSLRWEVQLKLYSAQEASRILADIAGLRQAPRENDRDAQRRLYLGAVERLVALAAESGQPIDRDEVIRGLIEREPRAAAYLM